MLKRIWDMACRIGLHHGDWVFVSRLHCSQGRTCGGCGERSNKVKHDVKWESDNIWFTSAETGVCDRCGEKLRRNISIFWG